MATMHNVRLDNAMATAERSKTDPSAAQLKAELAGQWRVDPFRPALGVADVPPFSPYLFELDVDTDASAEDVARIKTLADERCPAVWAMENRVEHHAEVRKR